MDKVSFKKWLPFIFAMFVIFYVVPPLVLGTRFEDVALKILTPACCLGAGILFGKINGWVWYFCIAAALIFAPTLLLYYYGDNMHYFFEYGNIYFNIDEVHHMLTNQGLFYHLEDVSRVYAGGAPYIVTDVSDIIGYIADGKLYYYMSYFEDIHYVFEYGGLALMGNLIGYAFHREKYR